MPARQWAMIATVSMLASTLSACGGESGVASAPPPMPTPSPASTPTPTPTPAPRASLVAPVQTVNPATPVASPGGASFRSPAASTTFPLLQVAVDGNFGTDQVTTSQGATLNVDGDSKRRGLTLNNDALGVVDATATNADRLVNGIHVFGAPIPGGRSLQVLANMLDYTVYGYWLIQTEPTSIGGVGMSNGGAWLGGYVTPASAVPATGSANYTGGVIGLYDESPGYFALVRGDVLITADFTSRTITGTITNAVIGSDNIIPPKMNDVALSAVYDPVRNLFEGTTRALANGSAFSTSAVGTLTGNFFGPAADEVRGVWTLSDDVHRLIGSFGAK